MLGIALLVVVLVVAYGLFAGAAALRDRVVGGRPPGRPRTVPAALALAFVLPAATFAAAPQDNAQARIRPAHDVPAHDVPVRAAVVEHITTVRYGPLLLPPYLGDSGGHGEHGGHSGQMVTYATPTYDMPCRNCYITGIQPDLVYADGSPANYRTGAMLHHTVLFDPTRDDVTCGRRGVALLTGRRVFAAGNERTGAQLPPGYGYPVGLTPFGAMAELMNMSAQPQQVFVTMTVHWVDAAEARLKEVTPVWLDVDNCGDSQYTIPAGPSHTIWTWKSTLRGDIVAVGGHVHDQGVSITLSNATRHEKICESVAGYAGGSHHEGHVESMSTCVGDPLATVRRGDDLALDSYYHSDRPDDTVMGIMIAYLHQR